MSPLKTLSSSILANSGYRLFVTAFLCHSLNLCFLLIATTIVRFATAAPTTPPTTAPEQAPTTVPGPGLIRLPPAAPSPPKTAAPTPANPTIVTAYRNLRIN